LDVVSAPSDRGLRLDLGMAAVPDYRQADFFGDVRVRQAIAQCIDRQTIVDAVAYGLGVVPDSYLSPEHPLAPGVDVSHWSYDPVAGRRSLEQAGWLDEDEDGVLEANEVEGVRDGTPFEITLLTASESAAAGQVARIVRANLADCGIRVHLESQPFDKLLAEGPQGPLFGRRFDLVVRDSRFASASQCARYLSWEVPAEARWDRPNYTGYSNPNYDTACQAALQALPGTARYVEAHRQAQAIFSTELPSIPLFVWPRVTVTRTRVQHLQLDPTSPSELWNIEQFDIE